MTKQQYEKQLEKLSDADLVKVAKAIEAKYRRAVGRGEQQMNPKLLRTMRVEIERVERGR